MSITPINKQFQCANCGRSTKKLHKDKDNEYTCERRSLGDIIKERGNIASIGNK